MPTYEYLCKACGHEHEIFQKITDEPITECPDCHKPALTKQISATNFQLKGTGWYVTDIRDKGKKKPTESSSDKPETANKTETKDGKETKDSKTKDSKSSDSSSNSGASST